MILYKEMIIYHGYLIEFGISEEELSNIITDLNTIILNNITYCSTIESIFGLNSECIFMFINDKLSQIKITPIVKDYEYLLQEFNVATLHDSFKNAYIYLYNAFENNKSFICIYKDTNTSLYNSNSLSINITFDDINEEVTMIISPI